MWQYGGQGFFHHSTALQLRRFIPRVELCIRRSEQSRGGIGQPTGATGLCCPNFFPRTRTGAKACRVVKVFSGGMYLKFSFDYYDILCVCPQGTFLGAAPRPHILVYEPTNVVCIVCIVCIVCMVLICICGDFYKAVTCRLEEPERPSEGQRDVYNFVVRRKYG